MWQKKKLPVNLGQTNTVIDFWSLHCIVAVYLSPVIFFSLIAQYTLTFRGLHTNQYDKNTNQASYDGVTVKAFDWLSKGRRFEPHRRRFFLQPQWNPYPTLTPPSC